MLQNLMEGESFTDAVVASVEFRDRVTDVGVEQKLADVVPKD